MRVAEFYYKNPNAPIPNKPNHIGVVAIIRKNDSILMECRSDSHKWSLIGGGLKINESLEDCLIREVKEETRSLIKNYKLFNIYSDPSRIAKYPDGNILRIITVAFIVRITDFKTMKCSDESENLHFFTKNELINIDIVETHKHIINDFLK